MEKTMNERIKKLWINALKSGKYKQTRHQLRRGDEFCCLGVLCDLHSKETGDKWDLKSQPKYGSESEALPQNVINWADLSSINPDFGPMQTLAEANDGDATFEEIAQIIEDKL